MDAIVKRSPVQALAPEAPDELEVKFSATPGQLEKVAADLHRLTGTAPDPRKVSSAYFDTADFALWKQGISLRLREKGARSFLQGAKFTEGDRQNAFLRGEVEVAVQGSVPDLGLFPPRIAQRLHKITGGRPLVRHFATKVARSTITFVHRGALLECALDSGEILAGKSRLPLAEVEIELKSGPAEGLYGLALQLCQDHGLALLFASKSDRGYQHVSGEMAAVRSAATRKLARDAGARSAFVGIVGECLQHFTANWAAFQSAPRPEVVHQLRVGLRRMRSAFSLFKPLIAGSEVTELNESARAIAAAFGPARKIDVFLAGLQAMPLAEALPAAEAQTFRAALAAYRRDAYAKVAAELARPETSAFVLKLESLLWRISATSAIPQLDVAAAQFARTRLKHLLRQAEKRGENLAGLAPPELHRLRISLKKLRYGIEFFAGALKPGRSWKRIAACASALQDVLGAGNDSAETQQLLAEAAPGGAHAGARGFVAGWQVRAAAGHSRHMHRKWKEFCKAARR